VVTLLFPWAVLQFYGNSSRLFVTKNPIETASLSSLTSSWLTSLPCFPFSESPKIEALVPHCGFGPPRRIFQQRQQAPTAYVLKAVDYLPPTNADDLFVF
jgi:hypothetical protein